MVELDAVVDWFHLGIYLGVPDTDLTMISHDYPTVSRRKTQALRAWMNMKEASWSDIVRALVSIRMKTLAAHIAEKYGRLNLQLHVLLFTNSLSHLKVFHLM